MRTEMRWKLRAKPLFFCALAVAALAVFGTALVSAETGVETVTETGATETSTEPPSEAPNTLLCPTPADNAVELAAAGDCLTADDCVEACPLGGRCDAGSCLCDPIAPALAVVGECTSDDDCDCPNGGRCEKYHCLCYDLF